MDQWEQTKKLIETARVALEAETREVTQLFNRFNHNLAVAVKSLWRQFLFIWGAVIVLAFSLLLVIAYVPLTKNFAHTLSAPGEPEKSMPPASFSGTASDAALALPEQKDLLQVLDQIREAQYKKDIDMFLKAYSPAFPDLGQKRELFINIWRRYDYIDLQFYLSDIRHKNSSRILGKVTWNIKARDRKVDEIKVLAKSYRVIFSRESGKWMIYNLEAINDKGA